MKTRGSFTPAPHSRSASICEAVSRRYWRRPSSAKALMKDSPIAIVGLPGDFVSRDDEDLFSFINTLRLSVKEKVAEEQQHGLSLAEIVVHVREMVRLAEQGAQRSNHFPSHAFRAISRQAVAWCVEAYQPLLINPSNDFLTVVTGADPGPVLPPVVPNSCPADRAPAQSPNSRDLP
ncbi:MAG: hypothetical protein QOH22_1241 [Gemmatimonadaceae bacterium]|nr:hypothetical protein [Gemmatimonadaceae bacterium]